MGILIIAMMILYANGWMIPWFLWLVCGVFAGMQLMGHIADRVIRMDEDDENDEDGDTYAE